MRLLKRTGCEISVFPRETVTGALGGIAEGFSGERLRLWGNVGYVSNTLNSTANALVSSAAGARAAQTLRLRFMGRAQIRVGDGFMLPGETEICWRCVEVNFYPFVTAARVERIAGRGNAS